MSHPRRTRWSTERRSAAPITTKQKYRRPDDEGDDDSEDELPGAYAITSTIPRRARSPPPDELHMQPSHYSLQDLNQSNPFPSDIEFQDELDGSMQDTLTVSLAPPSRMGDDDFTIASDDRLYVVSHLMAYDEEVECEKPPLHCGRCKSKWCITICAVCLIVAAGCTIFAAVVFFGGDDTVADEAGTGLHQGQDIDIRDPYVQCMSQSEITLISDGVQEAYNSLKALASLQPYLPRDIDITSCRDPANLALLWIALEVDDGNDYGPESRANRFMLLSFYASMGGPRWKTKDGWLTHTPECSWHGIECDAAGQTIKSITLHINNLSGTLESSLGLLTGLRRLDLSDNSISGSIPQNLWSLRELEDLFLGRNALVGNLPRSLADRAPSLRRLSLSKTEISGELPLLTRMSHLVEFDLTQTRTRGSFPTVGLDHLTSLEVLKLSALAGVTGTLPSSIALMTNLRALHLSLTNLSGTIPESVGEMTSLEELYIGSSGLSGTIPTSLGYLTNLTHLDLRDNHRLGGTIPSELGSCSRLLEVGLTGNRRITGTIPSGFASLSNLEQLSISCTDITGPFPYGICGPATTIYTDLKELHGSSDCACCVQPKSDCAWQ